MPKVRGFQTFAVAPFAIAIFAMAMLAVGLFPGMASAQQLPRLAGPPDPGDNQTQGKSDEQDQSMGTLKVNVNVVQLFFNVKDKKGALIPNLTKDDFQILEDGRPQTIKYFT